MPNLYRYFDSTARFFAQKKSVLTAFLTVFMVSAFSSIGFGGGLLLAQAEDEVAAAKQDSLLTWLLGSLGFEYIIIFLGLSFVLVAFFILNILAARRENVCPSELVATFESQLDNKQYQEAYDLAKTDESFLGNVLSAGLARLSSGYPQAVDAMQEAGADESMKMEHRLSYLALIGTISPMVGLFGTVHGMIESFYVIANSSATPKPATLAAGISTALMTTLIGLAIAIPAITAFNLIRNVVQRRILEVGVTSENLMGRFEKVGGDDKGAAVSKA